MKKSFLFHIDFNKESSVLTKYYINSSYETQIVQEEFFKPVFMLKKEFEELFANQDTTHLFRLDSQMYSSLHNEEILKITPLHKDAKIQLEDFISLYTSKTFEFDMNEIDYYLIESKEELQETIDFTKCRILSLDIETIGDVNNQHINLIALSSWHKDFKNVVFVNCSLIDSKNKFKKNISSKDSTFSQINSNGINTQEDFLIVWCKDEIELLTKMQEQIQQFQPQFIVGWNVISFDFKIIKEKFNAYNLDFNLSSLKGESKMRVTSEFFGKDQLYFPGIIVFDCIQLLKTNYIQYSDFKLSSVAKEVLGDDKVELDSSDESDFSIAEKIKTIEYNWKENPSKLIWYNFKDTTLVLDIIDSIKLMELMYQRSIITQTLLERLQSPIAVLDQMYLKELHKEHKVAPTHYPTQGTTPIEGAYVIEPKSGFYEDIVVFDFASLYPSLMITFNIDPFTYDYKKSLLETSSSTIDTSTHILAPNGAVYRKQRGILPNILQELFELRKEAKKKKESVKSHALKITMNSFYGAMASPKSRYYNKHLAESITAFGRECLLKVKEFLEEKENLHVIYGDTDSVFVECSALFKSQGVKNISDKKKIMQEIEKRINEYFSQWIQKQFQISSFLSIEAEKVFDRFFIASKKRYVGRDEHNKLQFTGMEHVRGDWTKLARDFQKELVTIIFNKATKEEITNFILDKITKLKSSTYDDKLVYLKKITKPLDQYTKTTPPHVKAARELNDFQGRVVRYVMTKQGPKHISLFKDSMQYDYEHYIEKQLKGVSDEILDAIGLDFDSIIHAKKQHSLNKFF